MSQQPIDRVVDLVIEAWEGPPLKFKQRGRKRIGFTDGPYNYYLRFEKWLGFEPPFAAGVWFGIEDIEIAKIASEASEHAYTPLRYTVKQRWLGDWAMKQTEDPKLLEAMSSRACKCHGTKGWVFSKQRDWDRNISEIVMAGNAAYLQLGREVREPNYISETNTFVHSPENGSYFVGEAHDPMYPLVVDMFRKGEFDKIESLLEKTRKEPGRFFRQLERCFDKKLLEARKQ